ncbi:YSC84-related protein [Endozoicomonas elysicola]|uniref:Ysc84 actin-binding domain-containing protein n=1 Tax=Endozoicomonas elysicola TaxID=305900 RepID=A0A081KDU3_9GAMM|nr:YSC84-related protein [Endozoicomonas elysicola]KEI72319.1 hypothetical protein GV64_17710 [Endozoicomonas elysicola]
MNVQVRFLLSALLTTIMMFPVMPVEAASKKELDATVNEALEKLYKERPAAKELGEQAEGILVFPSVKKGGLGAIGGGYGEGALLIDGNTRDYYRTVSASYGFQLGFQARTEIIMFMTSSALVNFQNSWGWEVGVDGGVAIAEFGAGGSIKSETLMHPVIGFILDSKGLMYNLTLEGSKITKIEK